jgi:hypothetical protein
VGNVHLIHFPCVNLIHFPCVNSGVASVLVLGGQDTNAEGVRRFPGEILQNKVRILRILWCLKNLTFLDFTNF